MEAIELLRGTGLDFLLLLFLRVSGLTLSSPIFGRQNIPNTAKIVFAMALTYFFFIEVPQSVPLPAGNLFTFVLLCAQELLIGLVMGYVLTLFFAVAFTAGHLIDMQIGFGMVSVFDVQSNTSVPIVGNLINLAMLLVFYAANGHTHLIRLLHMTLTQMPIGQAMFPATLGLTMLELFITAFVLAVRLALPVIASGLVGEVIMGIIVRTAPQMNVFSVGMPLKLILGLAVLLMLMPVYVRFSDVVFNAMFAGIEQAFATLAGA